MLRPQKNGFCKKAALLEDGGQFFARAPSKSDKKPATAAGKKGVVYMEQRLKDGSVLTIRPLEPADAALAIAYMQRVSGESDNLTYGTGEFKMTLPEEEAFIQKFQADGRSRMLGGFIEGELIGLGNLACESKPRLAHNGGIGLSVRRDYWAEGVGSALLMALIRAATAAGIKALHLEVNCENKVAIHLYEKYGFETVGRHEKFFYINGRYIDILLMDLYF